MEPIVNKRDAGQIVRAAQFRSGVSWAAIAQAIGKTRSGSLPHCSANTR